MAVRRKIPRKATATTVAVAEPIAPTTAALDLPPAALALADRLGHYDPTTAEPIPVGGTAAPFWALYSGKGKAATSLPRGTPVGTPYLASGEDYVALPGSSYIILGHQRYWATHDDQYDVTACWESKPPAGTPTPDGRRAQECAMGVLMILPGSLPLPKGVAPAMLTLSTFRGAQMSVLDAYLRAIETACTSEWARANGRLVGLQPRYRQVATAPGVAVPSKNSGNTYIRALVQTSDPSIGQLDALGQWLGSEEGQEEAAEFDELYLERAAQLARVASNTAAVEE